MKTETLKQISVARRIILISIVLYIVAFFVINASQLSADNIMRLMFDFDCIIKDKEATETISYEDSDNNFFTIYKNGLVSLTNTGVAVYNENNIQISEFPANYASSVVETGPDNLLVYERGGKEVYRTNGFKIESSTTLSEKIINLSADSRGYSAILTDEYGYKGNLTVYNKNFEELYFWKSSDEYPMYAVFMNDSTVAVIAIRPDKENINTVIKFLDFTSGEEHPEIVEKNVFPKDIHINQDKSVDVLTDIGIYNLTLNGFNKVLDIDSGNVSQYNLGEKYLVLVDYSDKAKNISSVNAYNKNAELAFTKNIENLKAVSSNSKYVFVSSGKTFYALDSGGNVVFEKELDFYIQKIVAAENAAFAIGNDSALRISVD